MTILPPSDRVLAANFEHYTVTVRGAIAVFVCYA